MAQDFSPKAVKRRMWSFSWPIGLEAMMGGWLFGADALMVASLGPEQVAGVALALAICAVPFSILWGLAHGKALLLAMAFGGDKNDEGKLEFSREVLAAGFVLLLLSGLVFSALSLASPYFVEFTGLTGKAAVYCEEYVVVSLLLAPTSAAHFFAADALRAAEHSKYASASHVFALILNIAFNFVLIFGYLGFPALGVAGAALGTGLSRLGATLVLVRKLSQIGLFAWRSFGKAIARLGFHLRRMVQTAVPIAIEGVGFSALHMVAIGLIASLGAVQLAAYEMSTRMTRFAGDAGRKAAQAGVGFELARMKTVADAPRQLIIQTAARMGLAMTGPLCLVMILATPLILNATMGEEHAALAICVSLVEISLTAIWTLVDTLNGAARGLNRASWPMKTSLVSLFAYLGWILLIRELGGGVIEITVAGHFTLLFVIAATIWKLRRTLDTYEANPAEATSQESAEARK